MEFFSILPANPAPEALQKLITIKSLSQLCDSIMSVITAGEHSGEIYTIWGQFQVNRELIKHGVRFSLPSCPNGFAWTITQESNNRQGGEIVIHATINRSQHEADFIESIETFVSDWSQGLQQKLAI
jgi:hypothetical protein